MRGACVGLSCQGVARKVLSGGFDACCAFSSHISVEEYHALADKVMDRLLESLEELVETCGDADQEVDYHVRESYSYSSSVVRND